jgi:hypothetical protein
MRVWQELFGLFAIMIASVCAPLTVSAQTPGQNQVPGVPSTYFPGGNEVRTRGTPIEVEHRGKVVTRDRVMEMEFDRQYFIKNLLELGQFSKALRQRHEARNLTSEQLGKDCKAIGKRARTIRSRWSYNYKIPKDGSPGFSIDSPAGFDPAIQRLTKLVVDFLDNPTLTNKTAIDVADLARAKNDLAAIISLSKLIEEKAKDYKINP